MTDDNTPPAGWRDMTLDGFMGQLGPLLRSDDKRSYGLMTRAAHKNHLGAIHGGVLASLLDQAVALAAWHAADRQPVVTVQMDTRFIGAARVGDFLEIRPTIRQATGSLVFVDADITCGTRAVASATAILKITKKTDKKND